MTEQPHLYLRSAIVYPGTTEGGIRDGVVEVTGERIVGVGSYDEVKDRIGPDDTLVDYGACTLLPGLVDSHAHMTLTGDGATYEQQATDPDEMMSLISVSNLQRHLASGVTTVRDNGGRNRVVFVVREAIERGYIAGPRLLLSGRPVTHSHGHFYWCGGEADSEAEIRAAVRKLVAEGADHIKIMASGGGTAGNIPYYPSYTAAELRTAVDAAHVLGRLTTAHCRARDSMVNAVEAGLDCIEHAEYLVPGELMEFGGGIASSGRMEYDPKVTERILQSGTFVSFTMQAGGYETLAEMRQRDPAGLTAADKGRLAALDAYFDMKLEIFSELLRDGALPKMVISSDAGPFDAAFGGLQHGLELAVSGGLSPSQAIDAATRIAADACGVSDRVGTLAAGKEADLLVVDGDATADIARLWDVRAVYSRGQLVAPLYADSGVQRAAIPIHPNDRARSQGYVIDC